jgi:hypothetical protein
MPPERPALCGAPIKSRMLRGSKRSDIVVYPSKSGPTSQNFTPIATHCGHIDGDGDMQLWVQRPLSKPLASNWPVHADNDFGLALFDVPNEDATSGVSGAQCGRQAAQGTGQTRYIRRKKIMSGTTPRATFFDRPKQADESCQSGRKNAGQGSVLRPRSGSAASMASAQDADTAVRPQVQRKRFHCCRN